MTSEPTNTAETADKARLRDWHRAFGIALETCLPALDVWSLDELIGYYVLYRKVNLDAEGDRHPLEAFGLYAVATRYPEGLARRHVLQSTAWDGVDELPWGGHQVRLIVLNRIEKHPRAIHPRHA